jgi:Cft2 family RNA processing exonuclease
MQVIFIGGASQVGASCLAIQLAGQWIVVDAGVRVDRKSDPLPDLALLEGKDVRAIFVTHAHADHIGALPLLHRAYPTVPIFASRGTKLLMEVMLADAIKIMTKRAVEEMELPLYPESLVASMLTQVRPLPVGQATTLSMLPGVTIHASRAGHIAGAISLGFVAADGSIVVSGDISLTAQRSVLGAVPPPVDPCDLLVLESTYGSRLHPNRQAEELRLAQAVADGIARGGHVLIPCFGLGRGQEVLLLLRAAQEKGQIPDFPIYVDGLVRRVCSTYLLLPEALSPVLQRQIRKGYLPFSGPNIAFVRDERERKRILAGAPACILSSSGMLTGGPSAWYAAQLAPQAEASILITGYQDEESPGKRLLDLAENKSSALDLAGKTVEVHCQVAKYSLSAHADGGELAGYADVLKARRVALVHGDEDARAALRTLLVGTEVMLPDNGMTIQLRGGKANRLNAAGKVEVLPTLPTGIGKGKPFSWEHVEELWRAVIQVPTLRIVTTRELALVWYGEVTETTTQSMIDVLDEDYEQRCFVRQHSLEEVYRVRGQEEEQPSDFLSELVGQVLFLQVTLESAKAVLCRAIEPVASVRVLFPRGVSSERTKYPYSAVLDVLGPFPREQLEVEGTSPAIYLGEVMRSARRIRKNLSARWLAEQCKEGATYTLGDLCTLAGVSAHALDTRLAIAKLTHRSPQLFMQQQGVLEGEGLSLYALAPEWREGLEEPEEQERPDQHWILSVIEQHIGTPPDLYRRSVDPDTGDVTLAFHFPDLAHERYAEALTAAAKEAGVDITLSANAHQGALAAMALRCIPLELTVHGSPSIYHEQHLLQLICSGEVRAGAIEEAESQFYDATRWHLKLMGATITQNASNQSQESQEPVREVEENESQQMLAPMNQHDALQIAQYLLGSLPGYVKVGAEVATSTLLLRFHFPDVAKERYAEQFAELSEKTGWNVRFHPLTAHHEALLKMAQHVLPSSLKCMETPSLYHNQRKVSILCKGTASAEEIQEARQRFEQETGWKLTLRCS